MGSPCNETLVLRVVFMLIVHVFTQTVISTNQSAIDEGSNPDCEPHGDCITKAREFVASYMKALRKDQEFDKCRHYMEVRGCLETRMKHCTHAHSGWNTRDWQPILTQLDRICVDKLRGSIEAQECIEDELRGLLSMRCDEYHKFNIQQRTRHECHFLRERLHCKAALVTSGCGSDTGNSAFHFLKIAAEKMVHKLGCTLVRDSAYPAFHYEQGACERGFLESIENCTSRYLVEKNVAKFHSENDLVILGTAKEVKSACRVFRRYETCIAPVKATCVRGIEMLLDYQTSLRRYVLKMEHICSDPVIEVYSSSVTCYQKVVNHSALDSCNVHWSSVNPWLTNITAFQYYCLPQHTTTINLMTEIAKLHSCYRVSFTRECGADAAAVMLDLIDSALKDPLYLRLRYKPDCYLHGGSTTTSPTRQQSEPQPPFKPTIKVVEGLFQPVDPTKSMDSVLTTIKLHTSSRNLELSEKSDLLLDDSVATESSVLQTLKRGVSLTDVGQNMEPGDSVPGRSMEPIAGSIRHKHRTVSPSVKAGSEESYNPLSPSSEMHQTENDVSYNGVRQVSLSALMMVAAAVFQLSVRTVENTR